MEIKKDDIENIGDDSRRIQINDSAIAIRKEKPTPEKPNKPKN